MVTAGDFLSLTLASVFSKMLTGGGASCCPCSCFQHSFSLHDVRCHASDSYPADRTHHVLLLFKTLLLQSVCGGSCVLVAFQLPAIVLSVTPLFAGAVLCCRDQSRVLLVEVACRRYVVLHPDNVVWVWLSSAGVTCARIVLSACLMLWTAGDDGYW